MNDETNCLTRPAELRADHHRDGKLDQVPAHDEVLEPTHAGRLPNSAEIFSLSAQFLKEKPSFRSGRAHLPDVSDRAG
jgi:hypothetical protein